MALQGHNVRVYPAIQVCSLPDTQVMVCICSNLHKSTFSTQLSLGLLLGTEAPIMTA